MSEFRADRIPGASTEYRCKNSFGFNRVRLKNIFGFIKTLAAVVSAVISGGNCIRLYRVHPVSICFSEIDLCRDIIRAMTMRRASCGCTELSEKARRRMTVATVAMSLVMS